jgi:hypothetical protein
MLLAAISSNVSAARDVPMEYVCFLTSCHVARQLDTLVHFSLGIQTLPLSVTP